MAGKDHVLKWSGTAASNTDIANIGIQGTNLVSNFDNAEREMMAEVSLGLITRHVVKTVGTYTALLTDHNQFWRCTGAVEIDLTAAATLTTGWCLWIKADGGAVTIDPNGSENINGASTSLVIPNGGDCLVICTGTEFFTVFNSAELGSSLTLTSTDAGAAAGPIATLYRNSASPLASDIIGQIKFDGEDSAGNKQTYADIHTVIVDPTSGSEDSTVNYRHTIAGVTTTHMQASATGTLIPTLAITAGAVISGVWTPTASLGTNAAVVSASEGRYTRVGNVVFCAVQLSCDPTSASVATDFFITLPVASDITSVTEITGGGGTDRGEAVFVLGVTATDRASVRYTPNSTASSGIYVTFGYVVV